MAASSSFDIAPTGDDGHCTVRFAYNVLQICLLDNAGQRMGADPTSDDDLASLYGAPYRLTLASGEIRWGYADATGMLVQPHVDATGSCTLEWGLVEGVEGIIPFDDGDPCDDYFLFKETIVLDPAIDPDAESGRKLSNLGYGSDLDDARTAFATDYGASQARYEGILTDPKLLRSRGPVNQLGTCSASSHCTWASSRTARPDALQCRQ